MTTILVPFRWLFAPPPDLSSGRSVVWWEVRRVPVNLLIAAYAVVCLLIYLWGLVSSGALQPGNDAIEPMGLLLAAIVAPVLFNLFYTLGWIVELSARAVDRNLSPRFGPVLLALGLGLSLSLISLPAVFWGGYRCLQLVGLAR